MHRPVRLVLFLLVSWMIVVAPALAAPQKVIAASIRNEKREEDGAQ